MRHLVLGLLRDGQRLHGYALWKAVEERFGRRIQNGKFHCLLKTMADIGWIRLARRYIDRRAALCALLLRRRLEHALTDLNWLREVRTVSERLHAPVAPHITAVPRRRASR